MNTPFTNIVACGLPGNEASPTAIDELLDILGREPLDAKFEEYGNFITVDPRQGVQTSFGVWEDGDLLFPEHPGLTRFWGNFAHLSHVFNIDTTDKALIEKLTAAIRANQRTQAYADYKALPPSRFFAAKQVVA